MPDREPQHQARSISFELSNRVRITAELFGDADTTQTDKCGWSSIDVFAEFPSGHRENLCCVDFEMKDENPRGFDQLRVMTFTPDGEDPNTISTPLPHRSIWISLDEDTYDVNVWDEDANMRDDFYEVGHIPSLAEAERVMNQLIQDHSFIWTRRSMQMIKGCCHD